MRSPRKWFVVLFMVSLCLLITWWFIHILSNIDTNISCTQTPDARVFGAKVFNAAISDFDSVPTHKRYGKNIIYYDFFKIPDNLIIDIGIKLPHDLKKFLKSKWNSPGIKNRSHFEQEVWEEANKLGYTPDKVKNMGVKEAIMAAVKIVASRLTFCYVDRDDFAEKHGAFLPHDVYFHLKLGDCDKYRGITIGVFNIIKKLNLKLQNVYLSTEELGGNSGTGHAWVSVVIPQHNYLVLSHIDPTFYDTSGGLFEKGDSYICLEHNIFIAYFYKSLYGYDNYIYAYQILEEGCLKVKNKKQRERILSDMSFIVGVISIHKPKIALDKILQVLKQYETEGFTENLDAVLYRAYQVHLEAGNKIEAEKYKQRLLKEFPNSHWIKWVKK